LPCSTPEDAALSSLSREFVVEKIVILSEAAAESKDPYTSNASGEASRGSPRAPCGADTPVRCLCFFRSKLSSIPDRQQKSPAQAKLDGPPSCFYARICLIISSSPVGGVFIFAMSKLRKCSYLRPFLPQ
jgi:hypothetical protein